MSRLIIVFLLLFSNSVLLAEELSEEATSSDGRVYTELIEKGNFILEYSNSRYPVHGSLMNFYATRNYFMYYALKYGEEDQFKEILYSNYLISSPVFAGNSDRVDVEYAPVSYVSVGFSFNNISYVVYNTSYAVKYQGDPAAEEDFVYMAYLFPTIGPSMYNLYRPFALQRVEKVTLTTNLNIGLKFSFHLAPILGGPFAYRCCDGAGVDPYIGFEASFGDFAHGSLASIDSMAGIRLFPTRGIFLKIEGFVSSGSYSGGYGSSSSSDSSSSSSSDSSSSSSSSSSSDPSRNFQAVGLRFGAGVVL